MKPVSYKAREGTGGLHRHPCSKAAMVADLSALSNFQMNAGGHYSKSSPHSASSSSGHSARGNGGASGSKSAPSPSSQMNLAANLSMNSLQLANLGPNFPFNFPDIKYEQSLSSPEHDEEAPTLRLLETAIKELIPWDVTNDALNNLITEIWHDGLDQGFVPPATALEPLLSELYRKGYHKVREEISDLDYLPIIVDIWRGERTDTYATLWISLDGGRRQMLKTIDITLVDNSEQLIAEVDKARVLFCSPLQQYVYIFDNHYSRYFRDHTEPHFLCPLHELEHLLDDALLNSKEVPLVAGLRKVQQYCKSKGDNFLQDIVEARTSNWFERLTLVKAIREVADSLEDLFAGDDQAVKLVCDDDLWTFLQPFHDSLQAFATEPSMNVITLWRAKLDDHSRPRDGDSAITKTIKGD